LPLEVAKPVTITGTAGSELQLGTPKRALLKITSSNVNISNLKLTGPNYTVNHDQERAIEAVGASAFAPLSQITIENCEITSWGGYGVYLKYVHDFTVNGNRISRIDYAAVHGLSVKNGMISNNVISNVIGTP
jgi:parallel beta-helix repeat protein